MAYIRTQWREGETPLSAQNLNNIEDGIEELQAQKVDKVTGMTLSSNDYTTEEKTKLAGIAAGAEVNPGNATTSEAGLMSAADKTKLNGIAANATANPDAIKNITRSGTTFTATRANNTTFTFTQQDTTYGNATTSAAGLMSATDKTKLDKYTASPSLNFAITSNAETVTVPATTSYAGTITVSNPGYMPLGIVGFSATGNSGMKHQFEKIVPDSMSAGSCKILYTVFMESTVQSNMTVKFYILWVRI